MGNQPSLTGFLAAVEEVLTVELLFVAVVAAVVAVVVAVVVAAVVAAVSVAVAAVATEAT